MVTLSLVGILIPGRLCTNSVVALRLITFSSLVECGFDFLTTFPPTLLAGSSKYNNIKALLCEISWVNVVDELDFYHRTYYIYGHIADMQNSYQLSPDPNVKYWCKCFAFLRYTSHSLYHCNTGDNVDMAGPVA